MLDAYGAEPCDLFGMFRQSACGWPAAEPAPYWRSTLRIERSARRFKALLHHQSILVARKFHGGRSNPQPANCISWPQTQALPGLAAIHRHRKPCGRHHLDARASMFVLHRWRHQATLWKTEGADKLNFHLSKKIDLPLLLSHRSSMKREIGGS